MHKYLATILLSLFLFSCSNSLTEIHVGTTPFFGETAFYIAQSKGLFEDQGLKVVSHPNSAGKKSLQALFNGDLDIAHVAELPIVYALAGSEEYKTGKDISLKIFANMIHVNNIQKIIARKDSDINSANDLINKKIGFYKGTTSEFFLDTFLLEHNIKDSLITKVNIDVSEQLNALKEGKVDAVVSWEPHASKMLAEMGSKVHSLDTMIDHSTLWLAVTSASYIDHNKEDLVAYLTAIKKAQRYIQNNQQEAQKMLARKTNSSQQVIQNIWGSITYDLSLGEQMLILLEDQHRWLRENKRVKKRSNPINIEDAIYLKAMEKVYPQGISIIR
ncbi:ABC transporter substrate-binding protein [Fodinibius sp. AD559]|uniref:ABC transporter substrate-binding protein n=1 Tax=Fodinibius sp. AD559 TaxID=3424179 RepID=UPI004046CC06